MVILKEKLTKRNIDGDFTDLNIFEYIKYIKYIKITHRKEHCPQNSSRQLRWQRQGQDQD